MHVKKSQITQFVLETLNSKGLPPAGKSITMDGRDFVLCFGREKDGRLYVHYEWYVPESYGDDDASCSGFRLPARMGSTRMSKEVHGDTVQSLSSRFGELAS